jgi:hypothetical protein
MNNSAFAWVLALTAAGVAGVVHVYSGGGGSPKSVSGAIVFKK